VIVTVSRQNTATASMLVNQSKPVRLNRAQDVSSKLVRQFIQAMDGIYV
jgi:hypothetical protein